MVREEWQLDARRREAAYAQRQARMQERLEQGARLLEPLLVGQEVAVQDPSVGGKAGKWNKSGTVVEILPYDAYLVRIHGSRHVSKRNRSHLRKIAPFKPEERLYPAVSPEAQTIPQDEVIESTDRFIAVQPPRRWDRLSPLQHRQQPVGQPGEDVVARLREAEEEAKQVDVAVDEMGSQ